MATYTYKLYPKQKDDKYCTKYHEDELRRMTTYHLREICTKERLVRSQIDPLDREQLIRLIMQYRGKKYLSLINRYCEEGNERVEAFIQKVDKKYKYDETIAIPSKMTLYEDLGITVQDNYKVKGNEVLEQGNVLVVDENWRISTILNLMNIGDGYYLTKGETIPAHYTTQSHYHLLFVPYNISEVLYDLYYGNNITVPAQIEIYKLPLLDFSVCPVVESTQPLIIDFGTSNTTIGTYEDGTDIKMVEVCTSDEATVTFSSIIPSVIAVSGINGEEIEYVYGYEAMKLMNTNYIKEGIHLFYDIKRWVSDYERMEKLTSEDGQYRWVKRSELLKYFMEYIINLANTQFKCKFKKIHLLTPVKQNIKFKALFSTILEDYEVTCDLDEGTAVLFSTIYNLIQGKKYEPCEPYRALIIDCGGGTTDLTACTFSIDNKRVAYHIAMQTSYENGDTNFGGNNLTYRIMQLLKIELADKIRPIPNKKSLFKTDEKSFNQMLEQLYDEAEKLIPTRFKEYEVKNTMTYFKVKQNYYYLFEVAEQIKTEFFKDIPVYEVRLLLEESQSQIENIRNILLDKWKIHIRQQGQLIPLAQMSPIHLNRYMIYQLLKEDVYQLLHRLLNDFFIRDELSEYQIIKLTGQSCQVELFREALKEYVPGKVISYKKLKNQSELKLSCIQGALEYYRNVQLGFISAQQDYIGTAFPYQLTGYSYQNVEKILINALSKKQHTGTLSRFQAGMQLYLYLKDAEGKVLRDYSYEYDVDQFEPTTYHKIEATYGDIILQDETDAIENEEIKFFVWTLPKAWGFYILPILRKDEILHKGQEAFFEFENDTWEKNFFDGTK